MSEPIVTITTAFIPVSHFEGDRFYPAVRRESNVHPLQTTVYEMSFDDEATALTFAKWFADSEREMYQSTVKAFLNNDTLIR